MNDKQMIRVLFDIKADRSIVETLKSVWLEDLTRFPGVVQTREFYQGKERPVVRAQLGEGEVGVTTHEWGLEYFFSFGIGVASGVIGNAVYATLKRHLFDEKRPQAVLRQGNHSDVHIDVELDTSAGPVTIAIVTDKSVDLKVTAKQLAVHIKSIQEEYGWGQ